MNLGAKNHSPITLGTNTATALSLSNQELSLGDKFVQIAGDTMVGTLQIDVNTAGEEALILKSGDDDTTSNLLECRASNDDVLTSIAADGAVFASGAFDQNATTVGTYVGVGDGTPRLMFSAGVAATNWQIDNLSGTFRWFLPGALKFSLSATLATFSTDMVVGGGSQQTNATTLQLSEGWTFKESSAPTADDGYAKMWTETNNELFYQSGDGATHLLHGDAFSNIWYHGSTTGTMTVDVTIAAQNALALINSFTVVGNEDDLANVVGSTSTNNLTLSAIGGGEYEISFHGSVTATGGADKNMMIALGITLATPKDITDVTDNLVTPIVITSTAHGLENGDMVEIVGVLGNDAANGSFIVSSKADDTFEIIDLSGGATTGDGDFNQGSPTGDVTILYPGNMIVQRAVRGADLGAISATGVHILANSDAIAVYVANLSGTTNLTVAAISFDAFRIGD